jgi:MFS family permease
VYHVENIVTLVRTHRARRAGAAGVGATVFLLGLTSLLTDISSEMVVAVIPIYLVGTANFSPLAFGFIDGLYQGAAAVVRLVGGFTADRWRRHKEVAGVGYGVSAVCKLGYLAVGSSVPGVAAVVGVDRAGKGIRTAPRDAMIALSSAPEVRATAFGIHRGLDTAGAMLGPIVAFALLTLASDSFTPVFVVSFCFAILGLAVLLLFVRNPMVASSTAPPPRIADALAAFRDRGFRRLAVAGGLLGLATISDAFLYLGLEQSMGFRDSLFPLLFVGTALVYMLLAVPMGRLADRVGPRKVFLAGYAILAMMYTSLLLPTVATPLLLVYLLLFGTFYAATDGVLMAIAANLLSERVQASGMALLLTVIGFARFASSVLFGLLWTRYGIEEATVVFLALLAAALVAALVILRPTRTAADAQ